MNAIDRVKELLAGAESRTQSRRIYSRKCLADLSIPFAQALIEIQEALVLCLCTCDYLQDTCPLHSEYIERQIKESWTDEKVIQRVTAARAAVRLDDLAKAMKR